MADLIDSEPTASLNELQIIGNARGGGYGGLVSTYALPTLSYLTDHCEPID